MAKFALALDNIQFQYDDEQQPLFSEVSFTIENGQFISIVGISGSGKTTLFRLITGLENPTDGEIRINDSTVNNRFGHVGYMPQKDLLMPWRTIRENAQLPLEMKGEKKQVMRQKVDPLLDAFGLKGYANKYPRELSGGMRQRVSFLRTILSGSNLLLLDEPFSALDAITKLSMQEWLLTQWSKQQQTILFITHDVQEALYLSDGILVLEGGANKAITSIDVPLDRPRTLQDLNKPEILHLKDMLLDKLRDV
jgi:putative hydroxymethylpyrimidine transport system ATP-binding protein